MANLVTPANFVYELAIPLDPAGAKQRKLCAYIAQYEAEWLQYALGSAMTTAFLAGVTASTPKWLDLRDGATYTVNGKEYRFGGVIPLISRYVYYQYCRSEVSTTTMVGEVVEQAANSTEFSLHKAVQMFNKMSWDMGNADGCLWSFLNDRVDDNGDKVYDFDCGVITIKAFKPQNLMGI